jgi:acyl dehydratase
MSAAVNSRDWFEDIALGVPRHTPSRTVTETDVALFGGLTGDLSDLHLSETYARTTAFGGRIAHGMLSLSLAHGLVVRTGYLEGTGMALLGWNAVSFRAPVRIGDTVRARWTTIAKRESRKHTSAGIVTDKIDLILDDGSLAVSGDVMEMVRKRPV